MADGDDKEKRPNEASLQPSFGRPSRFSHIGGRSISSSAGSSDSSSCREDHRLLAHRASFRFLGGVGLRLAV